jgi:hypothetical protein
MLTPLFKIVAEDLSGLSKDPILFHANVRRYGRIVLLGHFNLSRIAQITAVVLLLHKEMFLFLWVGMGGGGTFDVVSSVLGARGFKLRHLAVVCYCKWHLWRIVNWHAQKRTYSYWIQTVGLLTFSDPHQWALNRRSAVSELWIFIQQVVLFVRNVRLIGYSFCVFPHFHVIDFKSQQVAPFIADIGCISRTLIWVLVLVTALHLQICSPPSPPPRKCKHASSFFYGIDVFVDSLYGFET